MDVSCPHCGGIIENDGSFAGQVVLCPHCQGQLYMPPSAASSGDLSHQAAAPPPLPQRSFVELTHDMQVQATCTNPEEAKLAVKELKLLKQQLNLYKRQANQKSTGVASTVHARRADARLKGDRRRRLRSLHPRRPND
jgi:hypothetical protein